MMKMNLCVHNEIFCDFVTKALALFDDLKIIQNHCTKRGSTRHNDKRTIHGGSMNGITRSRLVAL